MSSLVKVSTDALEQFVHTHVTKPTDCIIYEYMNDHDNLYVTYYKSLRVTDDGLEKVEETNARLVTFRIRKSDIVKNQMPFEALLRYISNGLKYVIGWNFENIITALNTSKAEEKKEIEFARGKMTKNKIEISRNIRFPEQTVAILRRIAGDEKFIQFITTRSLTANVEDYISQMFLAEQLFCAIQGHDGYDQPISDLNQSAISAKVKHFKKTLNQFKENSAIDENGFLSLDKQNPFIDVIDGYIVEKDINNKMKLERAGLHVVLASSHNNAHLIELNQRLELGMTIEPTDYKKPKYSEVNHQSTHKPLPRELDSDIFFDVSGDHDIQELNPLTGPESKEEIDSDHLETESNEEPPYLLRLDHLCSVEKKLQDIPNDINNKLIALETYLREEKQQLQQQVFLEGSSPATLSKQADIATLVAETNALTQQFVAYYKGSTHSISQHPIKVPTKCVNIELFLATTKKTRLIELQKNVKAYEEKLFRLNLSEKIKIISRTLLGAVLGFVAGALFGFMIGSIVGTVVGATTGVVIGGSIGALGFGAFGGLTVAASSASFTYGRFFNAIKNNPAKKIAYEYSQAVKATVQEESTILFNRIRR